MKVFFETRTFPLFCFWFVEKNKAKYLIHRKKVQIDVNPLSQQSASFLFTATYAFKDQYANLGISINPTGKTSRLFHQSFSVLNDGMSQLCFSLCHGTNSISSCMPSVLSKVSGLLPPAPFSWSQRWQLGADLFFAMYFVVGKMVFDYSVEDSLITGFHWHMLQHAWMAQVS